MPLQNRVDPYGRLQAVRARGAWLGNRGVLHDDHKRVVAAWRLRRWITCTLTFKDRRREVFTPNRYSELFFLDEATSLAAGHRPCAECRRSRYEEFRTAWVTGTAASQRERPSAVQIDRVLHAERLREDGGQKTHEADRAALPEGAIVELDGRPHLLWAGRWRPWSFIGYGPPVAVPSARKVKVLTPRSVVRAIGAGFVPQVHESAGG